MDPAGAPPPSSRFAPWRRPAGRGAAVLAGLALLWTAAHALADRVSVRARIRDRAEAVLAARLPSAALGDQVSVDWLFRASVGPLTIPAVAPGAPPVVGIERVKVRVAWLPLLTGRIEPASVRLYGVRLVPGPGGRELLGLLEQLRRARPSPAPGPAVDRRAPDPVVHLRALTVQLALGARTVELGPFDLKLERTRDGDAETLAAELGFPGGGHAEATLRRTLPPQPPAGAAAGAPGPDGPSTSPRLAAKGGDAEGARGTGPRSTTARPDASPWSLTAHLAATAADLPAMLRGRSIAVIGGALALTAEAEGTSAGGSATLRGGLAGLVLKSAALGPEPVGPLQVTGEATLEGSVAGRRLRLRRAVLQPAGPLVIEASGALTAAGELPFELSVLVPPVDYEELLTALPGALAPGPDAPAPGGAVGGTLSLSGPLRTPAAWTVRAEVDLAGLREAARKAPPSPLRAPFTAHPAGDDGPAILLGPANPAFVPVAGLPEHVVRAVTTSEDAGFFAHRGFDFDELRNAMVAGARAGRMQRGGSTITQQLAKNLFLSRDRTLARKAREALITVALEGTVPKARLLELYLNLIEWGPGLHGIGPAARHYLDKDARLLTPREACFLATLIPSPIRSHAALAGGVPTRRWAERIDDLLRKLGAAGVLDEETLARELAAPLTLAAWVPRVVGGEWPEPIEEPSEDPALDEADGSNPAPPPGEAPDAPSGGPKVRGRGAAPEPPPEPPSGG